MDGSAFRWVLLAFSSFLNSAEVLSFQVTKCQWCFQPRPVEYFVLFEFVTSGGFKEANGI